MKKIVSLFVIIFTILIMSNYSLAVTAEVNATAIRIRESASTDSNILTNAYKEDKVEILEENGEWYKVKYGETVGYAKAEFFTKKEASKDETNQTNTVTETTPTEEAVSQNTVPAENSVETPEDSIVPNPENTETTTQELNVGDSINLQNSLKVRVIPSFSADEKNEIAQGSTIVIETKMGNWYKITDQTISAWVTKAKIIVSQVPVQEETRPEPQQEIVNPEPIAPETTETTPTVENTEPEKEETTENTQPVETTPVEKTAIVIVETARVRESASTNANIIGTLDEDDVVKITAEEGNFYKISTDTISGYVSKSLLKEKDVTSRSTTEERIDNAVSVQMNDELNEILVKETSSQNNGDDVISFAKQYLGYPYVLGCSTPESGFDCSGFTRYVFGHFGYTLGSVADSQTSVGEVIERENLQTGDLILFYNEGKTKIGHTGIFIGDGDFIHSANPQRGVVIDNLNTNSYYSQRFVTARRIVQ